MIHHQYSSKFVRRNPKRLQGHRRFVTLLVSLLLVLSFAVGGTLAFIMTETSGKKNTFTPAQVSCKVNEDFNGAVKSSVTVENTGETDAYIRAAVSITWMKNEDASDQTVAARVPAEGVDYDIAYLENTGWMKGGDGYWYYQTPVAPGADTGVLIRECRQLAGANVPQGYHLSVEIVASAIQSSPAAAVTENWHVTLDGDRIVSAQGNEVTGE